ncbi:MULTISPECIES: hypothetical protein [Actinosynnema]|uniref:hypothetical protein n=1 Tax=Actinosynnema TaxID=40566 RepID=UPI0020A34346|nr:hypothetical protein [Actinosynnema pretiosum]MCP2098975.1 hypothetical protein [Actinosynnema pretiosum]
MDTVQITVEVTGTCPSGHPVSSNLSYAVVQGSHGAVSANATCPVHGQPVHMSGTYTA